MIKTIEIFPLNSIDNKHLWAFDCLCVCVCACATRRCSRLPIVWQNARITSAHSVSQRLENIHDNTFSNKINKNVPSKMLFTLCRFCHGTHEAWRMTHDYDIFIQYTKLQAITKSFTRAIKIQWWDTVCVRIISGLFETFRTLCYGVWPLSTGVNTCSVSL